ncbi:hypothetical protein C8R43DRAFT_1237000 [Mycena crocata]|nr:hypothetical protein C8R43DRAFT_1237000 [Mycena crocata]
MSPPHRYPSHPFPYYARQSHIHTITRADCGPLAGPRCETGSHDPHSDDTLLLLRHAGFAHLGYWHSLSGAADAAPSPARSLLPRAHSLHVQTGGLVYVKPALLPDSVLTDVCPVHTPAPELLLRPFLPHLPAPCRSFFTLDLAGFFARSPRSSLRLLSQVSTTLRASLSATPCSSVHTPLGLTLINIASYSSPTPARCILRLLSHACTSAPCLACPAQCVLYATVPYTPRRWRLLSPWRSTALRLCPGCFISPFPALRPPIFPIRRSLAPRSLVHFCKPLSLSSNSSCVASHSTTSSSSAYPAHPSVRLRTYPRLRL